MRTKGTPRPTGVPLTLMTTFLCDWNSPALAWSSVTTHISHWARPWRSSCTLFTTACSLPANKQQPDPYCPKERCFTAWGKRCHTRPDSFSDSQHCCPKYAQVMWNARCRCPQPKIKRHKAHLCDHHAAQSALWCCTCEMDDGLLCASQTVSSETQSVALILMFSWWK